MKSQFQNRWLLCITILIDLFTQFLCVMLHGTGMFHRMYQKKFIVNEIYLNKLLLWYKTYFWEQMPILKLEWFGDDTAKWGNCPPQLTQFKWWHHLWVFEIPDFLLTKMTMASLSSTNWIKNVPTNLIFLWHLSHFCNSNDSVTLLALGCLHWLTQWLCRSSDSAAFQWPLVLVMSPARVVAQLACLGLALPGIVPRWGQVLPHQDSPVLIQAPTQTVWLWSSKWEEVKSNNILRLPSTKDTPWVTW